MDLKVLEQKDNLLLSRKEIIAQLEFFGEKTPPKDEVKKKISEQLKVDEKLIVVKSVEGGFSSSSAKALIYSYLSEEELKKLSAFREFIDSLNLEDLDKDKS